MIAVKQPAPFLERFRRLHLIGIGGSGMNGIAEVLLNLDFAVSGSDLRASDATQRLQALGARISLEHAGANVADVDAVVVSSAIADDNPEIIAAREANLPILRRAEMLAELMRFRQGIAIAGTHGKTTTTSLVASLLAAADLDPTYVIGGKLNAGGSNARLGAGDYLVAEADESDGSFLLLNPVAAVITNIDRDHLEHFDGDFGRLKAAFNDFLHRLPFYGFAALCIDDPDLRELADSSARRVLSYGIDSEDAYLRAINIKQTATISRFELQLGEGDPIPMELPLPGRHNVLNALAATAVAIELGIGVTQVASALAEFKGVGRRFDEATVPGPAGPITLVDDYGHHPTELAAVFEAVRAGWPEHRLVVLFQPHRFTRTRDQFDDFATVLSRADVVVLTDIYTAGETPIPGIDSQALAHAVRNRSALEPIVVKDVEAALELLPSIVQAQDLLLVQGAGNVGLAAERIRAGALETSDA